MKKRKVCFFAPVSDPTVLQHVEFYAQDIRSFTELGFEVEIATNPLWIPKADFYFVWWWTWAFCPVAVARILRRPVLVTGVFNAWAFAKRPSWHRSMIKLSLAHADANVFASQMEFEDVPKTFRVARQCYIPLTVDTDVYRPPGKCRVERDIVFSVGLFERGNAIRKGMPEIVNSKGARPWNLSIPNMK